MADDEIPRGENGLHGCEWCGDPIEQPRVGRPRRYCSRTHRELAYRERKTRRRVDKAVDQAVAAAHSDSSVDERPPPPVPSVDETGGARPVPPPRTKRRTHDVKLSFRDLFSDGS